MSNYSIAIVQTRDKAATFKILRSASALGVSEISRRIGTDDPVVELDTWDFPIEMDHHQGVLHQQMRFRELIAALVGAGALLTIRHHAGSITEIINEEMLVNLFHSELLHLSQEHD